MKGPHSRITYVKRLPRKSSRWCIQAIESADERLPKQPHKPESTVMLNVSLGYSMQLHISLFIQQGTAWKYTAWYVLCAYNSC